MEDLSISMTSGYAIDVQSPCCFSCHDPMEFVHSDASWQQGGKTHVLVLKPASFPRCPLRRNNLR